MSRENISIESTRPEPWERQLGESAAAYAAFAVFRDGGAARGLKATAQAVGKSYSLIRRWAKRDEWEKRALAWDLAQERDLAEVARQERREAVRRQLQDADRLERLAMAKLSALVRRDPVSGELSLDPRATPRDAVAIYRLALEIRRELSPVSEGNQDETRPHDELPLMPNQELTELIALAKERAQNAAEGADDEDESEPTSEEGDDDG